MAWVQTQCLDIADAITSMTESVTIYTSLAEQHPAAFSDRLAQASKTLRGLHWITEQLAARQAPPAQSSQP